MRRKNRRDADDITGRDSSVSQRQFKTGKPLSVFANTLREENLLRDECHVVTELRCLQKRQKIRTQRKLTSVRGDVNLFHDARAANAIARINFRFRFHNSVTFCAGQRAAKNKKGNSTFELPFYFQERIQIRLRTVFAAGQYPGPG